MSGNVHCPVCGQRCRTLVGNNPWCRRCEDRLTAAGGGKAPFKRDKEFAYSVTQYYLATLYYNTKEPLEILNLSINWLDRASPGCDSNPTFNPGAGLKGFSSQPLVRIASMLIDRELSRYKKEDIDPNSNALFDIQGHRHPQLLYITARAAFRVYGPCRFALSWLRRAHQANKQVLPFILGDQPTVTRDDYATSFHTDMYKPTWAETPGAVDRLRLSIEDVQRRPCDGIGCSKVEDSPRAFKCCGGCKVTHYCGVGCQKSDWNEGYHKAWCRKKPAGSATR